MDIKTLCIYISISAICVLFLSILVYLKHSRFIRGSLYWLASIFALASASILFGLSPLMPAAVELHIGNSLLMVCPALMSLSFRRLYNKSLWPPVLLYGLSFLIFNLVGPAATINERIMLFGILFGALWLDPAHLALRKENRKYDGLLGASFLFVSVCTFLRVGGTYLYEKELDALLNGGVVQQTYIMVMGQILFIFIAGYILMLNSRYLERILANEAMLRAAIDNSPYAMVMTDPNGQVVSTNSTFEKITGYALPEIQSRGLQVLQAGDSERSLSGRIWSTLRAGGDWEGEVECRRRDGSVFWEKAAWNPVRTESGQITGFFGVTSDITERRRLEDFKVEIEHLMQHDLRAPLNAIIGLPKLIENDGGLSARQTKFLAHIREGGESMLEQIDRSLEMYRIESGVELASKETVDLRGILFGLSKSLISIAEDRYVAVECRYVASEFLKQEAPVLLSTDRLLLRRLLGNLLKNAIEASPEKGVVEMRVSRGQGGLRIDIHNAGVIPAEVRGRFFAKFNTAGKFQGTGLGAYGAKLIAGLLGYSLTFETSAEVGTTLSLGIPVSQRSECADEPGLKESSPLQS